MGRIPGELTSQPGTKRNLSVSSNIHQPPMGSSQPHIGCAACAPQAFENLTFLCLMGFSQRNKAENKGRTVRRTAVFQEKV